MLTKADIESYFLAEKAESIVFLGIGVLAILLGLVCWFWWRTSFTRGAAAPLVLVGLLLTAVGSTIMMRSGPDIARVTAALERAPAELKTQELPRMEKVMRDFRMYRILQIALLVIGLGLWSLFISRTEGAFWTGLGLALAAMATVALCADYFAERRGLQYLDKLQAHVRAMR